MKRFLFALLMRTGVTRLLAGLHRRKVTILCYHSVTEQPAPIASDEHKLNLPVSLFRKHLDHLQQFYNVISLDDFLAAMRDGRELPDHSVVLTFEDGIRNFLTVVTPHLKERGFPATTFVITGETSLAGTPESNHRWQPSDDRTFLSWADIRELSERGIQFGSHTCSHAELTEIPITEARKELFDSHAELAQRLPQSEFPLSYPYGKVSDQIRHLAREAGYSCAITTIPGGNDSLSDLFALRRTVIAADDDVATFATRVCGLTSWVDRIRRGGTDGEIEERLIHTTAASDKSAASCEGDSAFFVQQ